MTGKTDKARPSAAILRKERGKEELRMSILPTTPLLEDAKDWKERDRERDKEEGYKFLPSPIVRPARPRDRVHRHQGPKR
jgi:hypothetical protein